MPVLKVLKDGVWVDISGASGNTDADTLDGKHASDFASSSDVTSLQDLVGDTSVSDQISNAVTAIEIPVSSVNGKTGAVQLSASDVGALPSTTIIPSIEGLASQTYVNEQVSGKVDKIDGMGLSENSFTTAEKEKLASINASTGEIIVDDALSTTSANPVQNKIVTERLNNISTLVGDTSVSEQISDAMSLANLGITATAEELNYMDGVTSNVQTQLDNNSRVATQARSMASNAQAVASSAQSIALEAKDTASSAQSMASGAQNVASSALNVASSKAPNTLVTTTEDGLMSAADKVKLDGIEDGANNTVVDDALSDTSTNPVQNKVVNEAINDISNLIGGTSISEQIGAAMDGLAPAVHNHDDKYYTETEIDTKLATKVDSIEGSRLITSAEAEKLASINIGDGGNIEISGTVNAENVNGLDELLATKVDVVDGKGLSANDYTDEEKSKLDNVVNLVGGTSVSDQINAAIPDYTISYGDTQPTDWADGDIWLKPVSYTPPGYKIFYSDTQPTDWVEGDIWLKPVSQ